MGRRSRHRRAGWQRHRGNNLGDAGEGGRVSRRIRHVFARSRSRSARVVGWLRRDSCLPPMNVDYENLERDLSTGMFREMLKEELIGGFRQIQTAGERLPLASHYASQIAEIVSRGASGPLRPEVAFGLYQEILDAVESARATVLGEERAQ